MNPTSKFEILRYKKARPQSANFISAALVADANLAAGTETIKRGIALGAHATDGESFDLAQGTNFIGFIQRRVVVGGLAALDRFAIAATRIPGQFSTTQIGIESPYPDNGQVTAMLAEEIECEGSDYLYSGTGQITEATAVGTRLSFKDGKLRAMQANEVPYFTLSANNLTQLTEGAGNLRIRAVAV